MTTRLRTQDGQVRTTWGYVIDTHRGFPDNVHTDSTSSLTASGKIGSISTCRDNNNPRFADFQRAGAIVMSNVNIARSTRDYVVTDYEWTVPELVPGKYTRGVGDFAAAAGEGAAEPYFVDLKNDRMAMGDIALIKAYAKMNASPLLIGETVSDLSETVSMLRRPFGKSRDLIRRMTKYRDTMTRKTTASLIKATSNAWLEFRYGWQPLILDAEQIVERAGEIRQKVERLRLVARAGVTDSKTISKKFSGIPIGGDSVVSGEARSVLDIRASAGVMYEILNRTSQQEVDAFYGQRTRDLLPTFWETIPYSFVVDWFVGIGDWLQAVTPDPEITVRGNWVTRVTNYTKELIGGSYVKTYQTVPTVISSTATWGGSTRKTFDYTRDCNVPLPPHPMMTTQTLSSLHAADAMALEANSISKMLNGFGRDAKLKLAKR